MTRPVYWSTDALNAIDRLYAYWGADNPNYALAIVTRLEAAVKKLGRLPTGRPGRVEGTFEKSLPELRYVLVYEVDMTIPDGPLIITRVIHSAQDWPD